MSDDGDRAVFVFDADASYGIVRQIREAGAMPSRGLRYVAAVTGPWKVFKVMTIASTEGLVDVASRLDAPGDPETATSFRSAQVRKSMYRRHTALVRIQTSVADPETLIEQIREAIGSENGQVEADVVVGAFDILACVVDDDETSLGQKILNVRRIDGVTRTTSLRVIDYVSTSGHAPEDHRVAPAD
jgi:DNA-binding Lrp family transcriptional regulator